jgi:4-amino-4-deoxy-L-arabinose transferase-like glycosyltransferase
MNKTTKLDILAILILVLIAVFFRFHHLQELPIGLWRDEAANGLEALRVLDGDLAIFYGTREPMFIYLVALSVGLLGRNPLAIRLVAAIAGTATIPVTYLLFKEVFRWTDHRVRLLAFLTSTWLATSYWHLNFSRLGFRGVLLPLFASLSFYLFWRGWNQLEHGASRQRTTLAWFAVSGLCFGLTFYTYTPSRFLPLVLLPFFGQAVWGAWSRRSEAEQKSDRTAPAKPLAALFVFSASCLLIFAPLGVHFVADPGSFFVRRGVSVFSATDDQPLITLLAENVVHQLGMFGFLADPNTRHNPAGRPAFDLFTLAFFMVGFALSLRRSRKLPYLFCIGWFLIMLLPAILTYPELPHYLRAIGALPVACVFPALGAEAAWDWVRARTESLKMRSAFAVILGLCLAFSAVLTYRDYFTPRVEEIELVKAFDPRFVETAALMNELDEPGAVWIVPLGPHDEQRMAYFVIDFLYQGQAPLRYVHADEEAVARELSASSQGSERAMVLRTTEHYLTQPWYDLYADSRGLIPFLFDKHTRRSETKHFANVDVLVYQLPEDVVFSMPSGLQPQEIDFGDSLKLTGIASGLSSGEPRQAWVALQWQVSATPGADYGTEIALIDEQGERAGTIHELLLSGELQPTNRWDPWQQETSYHSFTGLPDASRGGYSIQVSVYPVDVDNGWEFAGPTAEGGTSLTVGSILPTVAILD